jgi:photosystem II stability/assembly factor-like uncharacterized protein
MNHGYVYGERLGQCAITATSDGGASWQLRWRGAVTSAFFLDNQTFWFFAEAGDLHHTTDGGQTFEQATVKHWGRRGPEAAYGKLSFLNQTEGWVSSGRLLHTTDAGKNWTDTKLPDGVGDTHRIWMFSATEGLAVQEGSNPLVFRTTDGWTKGVKVSEAPPLSEDFSCTTRGVCAARGLMPQGGPVFLSRDRGQTWQDLQVPLQLPDRDEIRAVQAVNANLIVVVGTDKGYSYALDVRPLGPRTPVPPSPPPRGIILVWQNGTWTRFTHDEPDSFAGLYFVDSAHGWLIGMNENLIYKTTDGGQTLTFVPDYFRQIFALTPSPTPFVLPTPTP